MSLPSDVRFHRALVTERPEFKKWDYDHEAYPLLWQIQDGQNELLERSFGGDMGNARLYLDFVTLTKQDEHVHDDPVDAFAFSDSDEGTVFIAFTRPLIDELLDLATLLSSSTTVRTLLNIAPGAGDESLADVFFYLGLEFLVAHEVGHYAHGHVPDHTLWKEFPELDRERAQRLQRHAQEHQADEYAIQQLCKNVVEGDCGTELAALLQPGRSYGSEDLSLLLAVAVTGVVLLRLNQHSIAVEPATKDHPPLSLRQHRIIEVMEGWLTLHGKASSAVADERHHAVMVAVGDALPPHLKEKWDKQVDWMESPTGQQYLADLDIICASLPLL